MAAACTEGTLGSTAWLHGMLHAWGLPKGHSAKPYIRHTVGEAGASTRRVLQMSERGCIWGL